MASGAHSGGWGGTTSGHQKSREARSVTGAFSPTRLSTRTERTLGAPSSAASTLALSATTCPRLQPPSAVTTRTEPESLMRSRSASGEKPPKTTECAAPIRAQASTATASSGTSGM
jgi:hypothetical protein